MCFADCNLVISMAPQEIHAVKKEIIMKSSVLFIALLCALTLSSSASSISNAANAAKKDWAVTRFDQPVELMVVTLKGEDLFIHDDAAMMPGEPCTFVYKGVAQTLNNLVVALHCVPATRG